MTVFVGSVRSICITWQLGRRRSRSRPGSSGKQIKKAKATRAEALAELARRNVEVYGAINVSTDGRDLAIAFLKERAVTDRWHIYWYRQGEQKGFIPIEK
ncbi:hypothetical protein [Sinorhizobium meliloti]|uniref:hypothetical protein n=1 Tax=Rhizobium meliloti TaxID=382 RepID=UPI0030D4F73D